MRDSPFTWSVGGRTAAAEPHGRVHASPRKGGIKHGRGTTRTLWRGGAAFGLMLVMAGCAEEPAPEPQAYDQAPVELRDIRVFVEAAGAVEPLRTVELKSKASGEILAINAENGDPVERSALLVRIDKRIPTNNLAQAEAALKAAESRQSIAKLQMERAERLVADNTITDSEFEETALALSEAEAQLVRARVDVENAHIALDDTDVLAPIDGTIIERNVEPGQVISSPTQDVGGGTLLLRMADLGRVLVRTRVDETDIGKINAGMQAQVRVAAYPAREFTGYVEKIEPLAVVEQNVTMFSVLILLDNPDSLLLPGMNAEVQIKIAEELEAPAVPMAALRTIDDIEATAHMLNWPYSNLHDAVMKEREETGDGGQADPAASSGFDSGDFARQQNRTGQRPQLSPEQRQAMRRAMGDAMRNQPRRVGRPWTGGARPGGGPGRRFLQQGPDYDFRAEYWVLVMRDDGPAPSWVRTGLSDFEYSVVLGGLEENDEVLLLPSAGLYESQSNLRNWMRRRSGGLPGIG
ncbi:MAG: efflux RND transporter periplasmic adaptor subunit [Gammaproteobacteria bacterium]|nr:efflux RND transporter periplasmic adaptor subunit [Gammaproteobacteria bacterium]MYF57972.1 efflux RND transporter periplasmic adaptor subunit [Gammaproteobacteria bacterium]